MIRVKICGITQVEDALMASSLGAYALGFVFYEKSQRYILPQKAKEIINYLPPFIVRVGVFVNEGINEIYRIKEFCSLDRIQLYSDDCNIYKGLDPSVFFAVYRIKSENDINIINQSSLMPLLDTYHEKLHGGTGKKFDWQFLKGLKIPFILAGGINADNVLEAIKFNPYAIDVSSGVEKEPGIKDHKKMFEFFKKIRENQ